MTRRFTGILSECFERKSLFHHLLLLVFKCAAAEIPFGVVGKDRSDIARIFFLQLLRGPEICAVGDADQKTRVTSGFPGGFNGVLVGHFYHFIHEFDVQHGGDETVADSLDLMQARLMAQDRRSIFRVIDKNSLLFAGSIKNAPLCVKNILPQDVGHGRCTSKYQLAV